MNGFEYILTKQISWADRNNVRLVGSEITKGRLAYTENLDKNLFEPLLPETRTEIEKGDGGELKGDSTHSAKMCAVHSSSAIGVNVLQYWKNKNIPDLAYALGLCRKDNRSANEIHFERKFKISDKFQFDPNIDSVILNSENEKIKAFGIECKYSEAYSSRNHSGLKERYLKDITEQWKDIPNLLDFAKTISPEDKYFKYLHPAQLVKHILGLKKKYGKSGFRLLYLWYDVLGQDGCRHRAEIEEFVKIAKKDSIKFHSLSYQELITKLKKDYYNGNEKYIDYLTDRYL
tara:strand:- start:352 stop:1218 length:867 start_codon:yes stop_codon:yes gene_type:complete